MEFADRLEATIEAVVCGVGRLASWLAVALMATIVLDVLSRSSGVFLVSSTKLQELEWHLHGCLFLLCLGFCYLKDAHVRIEIIRDRMRPRTRVWIELFGCILFVIPYSLIAIYWGLKFAGIAFDLGEASPQSGLPHRWIIKGMIPAGFTLVLLAGVGVTIKCILYLFGPEHLRAKAAYVAETHHAGMVEVSDAKLAE